MRNYIDIRTTKRGDPVKWNGQTEAYGGNLPDGRLEPGRVYYVKAIRINDYTTDVWLQGVEGSIPSVCLEPAPCPGCGGVGKCLMAHH